MTATLLMDPLRNTTHSLYTFDEHTQTIGKKSGDKLSIGTLKKISQMNETLPKFTVKNVQRLHAQNQRPSYRKLSHDQGRKGEEGRIIKSSLSLGDIKPESVLCCVRDSMELVKSKKATSSTHVLGRAVSEQEVLAHYHSREVHPKAYRHYKSPVKNVLPKKKESSYSQIHVARLQHQNKQQKQEYIVKQRKHNYMKHRELQPTGFDDTYEESTFPHTLPTAVNQPTVAEFPGLYSPLPPIHTADVGVEEEEDVDISDLSLKPEGYSVPKPKITYKPYTLKEYSSMKQGFGQKVGGLGPDTENSKYQDKLAKTRRMMEYASKIRSDHQVTQFPKRKRSTAKYHVPSKAEIGLQYSRHIPPPKPTIPRGSESPVQQVDREHSLLREDILRERLKVHLQHKRIIEDLAKL